MDVCTNGTRKRTGQVLTIEVEMDSAAIDAEIHAVRKAVLDAADQYTRKHFTDQLEHLSDCTFFPVNEIPKTWEKPVETSMTGIRIWGVTHEAPSLPELPRTNKERILGLLKGGAVLCDDCIQKEVGITRRQTVYRICEGETKRLEKLERTHHICHLCKKRKVLRRQRDPNPAPVEAAPSLEFPTKAKPTVQQDCYSREQDLKGRFNEGLAKVFRVEKTDYYSLLTIPDLMDLKSGYARINDIITLRLTMALVDWLAARLRLGNEQRNGLLDSVNRQHPNAGGYDVDCAEPNFIAEVKGNIPMNQGTVFGSGQVDGLTSDVLCMMGLPSIAKHGGKVKQKAARSDRPKAIKFLALFDSEPVRQATQRWKSVLLAGQSQQFPDGFLIEETPADGELSDNAVYLVFLKLDIPLLPALESS